jgi:pyridoxamine 5'-phosphate oxidase
MITPEQLAQLRKEYGAHGLRRADLDPDPIPQFARWLREAIAAQLLEPNAMTLSTVDDQLQPWSRVVLLKACDARGFVFFTNLRGAKSRQLAQNARAALTFWWGGLERQVNVTGTATHVATEEAETYFATRPSASRLGAWASSQSEVVRDRAQLETQWAAARAKFGEENIPMPPHWGGFCVAPETIEFWQGRPIRLHDRFRYTRSADGGKWRIERLSP